MAKQAIIYGFRDKYAGLLARLSHLMENSMKEGIHPTSPRSVPGHVQRLQPVTRSCANTKEMIKMEDGRELPLFKLDTTSESHPSIPARRSR